MKTLVKSLLVVIALLLGVIGYFFLLSAYQSHVASQTATSTDVVIPADIPVSTTTTNVGVPVPTTPTASAPLVETDSTVSSTTQSATDVSGTITPNGAQTSYWFAYGTTADSLGQQSKMQKIGSGYEALPASGTIRGLTQNTLYYFALVASNSQGMATGTVESFTTNSKPPPSGPTGDVPTVQTFSAKSINSTSATLIGVVNPDHSRTIYWFEYGTTPNMGSVTKLKSVGGGGKDMGVSADLSGLKPGTTYYFRVNANNAYGTSLGNVLKFTTPGKAAN